MIPSIPFDYYYYEPTDMQIYAYHYYTFAGYIRVSSFVCVCVHSKIYAPGSPIGEAPNIAIYWARARTNAYIANIDNRLPLFKLVHFNIAWKIEDAYSQFR